MNTGKLRHLITIVRYEDIGINKFGEETTIPVSILETRATVTPTTGRESYLNGKTNEIDHNIIIRYNPNIVLKQSDEIHFNYRVFDIQYIINKGELNREYNILVKERFND